MADRWNQILECIKTPAWVKKIIDHNRYGSLGVVLAVTAVVYIGGCQPKILSPFSGKPVTAPEFDVEVLTAKAELEGRYQALKRDSLLIESKTKLGNQAFEAEQRIIDMALGFIQSSASTVIGGREGAVTAGVSLLAGFLGLDNIRKRRIIKEKSK